MLDVYDCSMLSSTQVEESRIKLHRGWNGYEMQYCKTMLCFGGYGSIKLFFTSDRKEDEQIV